jgi:hypothetical protein
MVRGLNFFGRPPPVDYRQHPRKAGDGIVAYEGGSPVVEPVQGPAKWIKRDLVYAVVIGVLPRRTQGRDGG